MKKKLITILVAFGIAKAEAEKYLEKVDDSDVDTFDPQKIIADYTEAQKELLKNDKEFIGDLKRDQYAIAVKQIESKLKKGLGLTAEDVKEAKTIDEVMEIGLKKVTTKGDSTNQQLQEENLKLTNDIKELKEVTIPSIESKSETVKNELKTAAMLEKTVVGLDKKLLVGMTAAMATLREKLGPAYDVRLDAKGELEIVTKGDNLKPKNKAGDKFLNPKELIAEILDEEKLLENSGGGGAGTGTNTTTTKTIDSDEEKYRRFPHLKAAEEHAATQKAELEKNKNHGKRD